MRSHCVSEITEMEGRNDRRLTPGECSAPVPAPGMRCWQRRGVKPGRKPEDRCSIHRSQARERPERANKVNPRKLRYPELREMEAAPEKRTRRWKAAVVAEVSMSAMRAPRSRSIGGARHRSHLSSAEHGNPVAVRWKDSATGRPTAREADICGGNRTAKKQMTAAERQQESEGT
jgi:hypothetical protein